MNNSIESLIEPGIQKAINSASEYLNAQTKDELLGSALVRYAPDGAELSLFTLACYADGLRVVFDTLLADGKITGKEVEISKSFLAKVAANFAKVRKQYAPFASLKVSGIVPFLKMYRDDAGALGYKNQSTKWSGIVVCQNLVTKFGDSSALQSLRGALIKGAKALLLADGVDQKEAIYLKKLEEEIHGKISTPKPSQNTGGLEPYLEAIIQVNFRSYEDSNTKVWLEKSSSMISFWQKAAEANDPRGQVLFGLCLDFGIGIKQNSTEAFKWYMKAAKQGHARGQVNLGVCYRFGEGVNEDKKEAAKWFRLAADQGHPRGQVNLGLCYEYGNGVKEDKIEAVKWYRLSAEQGHAQGQFNLGDCYDNGQGVNEDKIEAYKWFCLAAMQGIASAQCKLGFCYVNGEGIKQDKKKAAEWFRKAADQGFASAQFNLGLCYYKGDGVKEDKKEAVKWFRKASAGGVSEAKNYLEKKERSGNQDNDDEDSGSDSDSDYEEDDSEGEGEDEEDLDEDEDSGSDSDSDFEEEWNDDDDEEDLDEDEDSGADPDSDSEGDEGDDDVGEDEDAVEEDIADGAAEGNEKEIVHQQLEKLTDSKEDLALARKIIEKEKDELCFVSLIHLSVKPAEILATFSAGLNFFRLENLPLPVVKALAKLKGPLQLAGLSKMTDEIAEALSHHKGRLMLDNFSTLSDNAALHLSKHQGDIDLFGLSQISIIGAKAIAKISGDLFLNPENLSAEVREILAEKISGNGSNSGEEEEYEDSDSNSDSDHDEDLNDDDDDDSDSNLDSDHDEDLNDDDENNEISNDLVKFESLADLNGSAIRIDAEELIEGSFTSLYDEVREELKTHGIELEEDCIEEDADTSGGITTIGYNDEEYILCNNDIKDSWQRGAYVFFMIINSQIDDKSLKFYAVNGGNDLSGILLKTTEAARLNNLFPGDNLLPYIPEQPNSMNEDSADEDVDDNDESPSDSEYNNDDDSSSDSDSQFDTNEETKSAETATVLVLDESTAIALVEKSQGREIKLNELVTLSPAVASILTTHQGGLSLDSITDVSDEVADILAHHGEKLLMDGLVRLEHAKLAEKLAPYNNNTSFGDIEVLSSDAAKALCKFPGILHLHRLPFLTPEIATCLLQVKGGLVLSSLKSLTPEVAAILSGYQSNLTLGLKFVSPGVIEPLSRCQGRLDLNGLRFISPKVARELANHRAALSLGIKVIDVETASALALHKGGKLDLGNLVEISEDVAKVFYEKHDHHLRLNDEIKIQSDAALQWLALKSINCNSGEDRGKIVSRAREINKRIQSVCKKEKFSLEEASELALYFNTKNFSSVKDLPLDIAKILCFGKGILEFPAIETLTEPLAEALGQNQGGLILNGLKSLSPTLAKLLCKFPKSLELNGLTGLTQQVAASLSNCKGNLTLDGLENLAAEVARELKNHHGELSLKGVKILSDQAALELAQHSSVVILSGVIHLSEKAQDAWATRFSIPGRNWKIMDELKGLCSVNSEALGKWIAGDGVEEYDNENIVEITAEAARGMAASPNNIYLLGLKNLQFQVARELVNFRGALSLGGVLELSDEIAELIAKFKSTRLEFENLEVLSPIGAKCLSKYQGKLDLPKRFATLVNESKNPSIGKPFFKLSDEAGEKEFQEKRLMLIKAMLGLDARVVQKLRDLNHRIWKHGFQISETRPHALGELAPGYLLSPRIDPDVCLFAISIEKLLAVAGYIASVEIKTGDFGATYPEGYFRAVRENRVFTLAEDGIGLCGHHWYTTQRAKYYVTTNSLAEYSNHVIYCPQKESLDFKLTDYATFPETTRNPLIEKFGLKDLSFDTPEFHAFLVNLVIEFETQELKGSALDFKEREEVFNHLATSRGDHPLVLLVRDSLLRKFPDVRIAKGIETNLPGAIGTFAGIFKAYVRLARLAQKANDLLEEIKEDDSQEESNTRAIENLKGDAKTILADADVLLKKVDAQKSAAFKKVLEFYCNLLKQEVPGSFQFLIDLNKPWKAGEDTIAYTVLYRMRRDAALELFKHAPGSDDIFSIENIMGVIKSGFTPNTRKLLGVDPRADALWLNRGYRLFDYGQKNYFSIFDMFFLQEGIPSPNNDHFDANDLASFSRGVWNLENAKLALAKGANPLEQDDSGMCILDILQQHIVIFSSVKNGADIKRKKELQQILAKYVVDSGRPMPLNGLDKDLKKISALLGRNNITAAEIDKFPVATKNELLKYSNVALRVYPQMREWLEKYLIGRLWGALKNTGEGGANLNPDFPTAMRIGVRIDEYYQNLAAATLGTPDASKYLDMLGRENCFSFLDERTLKLRVLNSNFEDWPRMAKAGALIREFYSGAEFLLIFGSPLDDEIKPTATTTLATLNPDIKAEYPAILKQLLELDPASPWVSILDCMIAIMNFNNSTTSLQFILRKLEALKVKVGLKTGIFNPYYHFLASQYHRLNGNWSASLEAFSQGVRLTSCSFNYMEEVILQHITKIHLGDFIPEGTSGDLGPIDEAGMKKFLASLESVISKYPAESNPSHSNWFLMRAQVSEKMGNSNPSKALALYNKGISQKRTKKKEASYTEAFELDPFFFWSANNLAWHLAARSDKPYLRDGAKAVAWASKSLALLKSNSWSAWDTLAAAHAAKGEFDKAANAIKQAKIYAPISELQACDILYDRYSQGLAYFDPEKLMADPSHARSLATKKLSTLLGLYDGSSSLTNSLGMTFEKIHPAEFTMGGRDDEEGYSEEGIRHRVRITKPYFMAKFTVTQNCWEKIMGDNPSKHKAVDFPVSQISWQLANEFCTRLSNLPGEQKAQRRYRLPTEAEWEYACRAGSSDCYSAGDSLSEDEARFSDERGSVAKPPVQVGTLPPNDFGFYEMHGNVWEWCSDWFGADYYQKSPLEDPQGPETGTHHTLRGGAASVQMHECRSSIRGEAAQDKPSKDPRQRIAFLGDFGLRVVCVVKDPQ